FSFLYEQDLNNSLFVSFAPRVDHYEDVDTNYTAAFLFGKKHSFWEVGIGLRRAAKAPSLYNLYDPTYGNVDLKPEFSEQVEVYMNYKMASQWEWAASFYKTNIKDRIDTDYSNPYENTGSYLLLGGEIEVKKSFYNGINFRLSEAYVNAENQETGKTLYGRPREVQSLFVGHTVNKHYYSLGLRHEKGIVSYGDILLDDFVLADFNYQYQLGKNAKLNFEIANLLNQHYQRVANFNSRARNYLLEYSVSY
ncbi:MAG: TonB-dependent receptor, partial [Bdellovibrionota bacterium]